MNTTWVLVAESSRAKIFAADGPRGTLQEIAALDHPEGRAHEQDLVSDLPGRTFDSAGQGRHAKEEAVSPKEQENIYFVKTIGEKLEQGRTHNEFDKLILIAPPAFLGLLRQHLPEQTRKRVSEEINKNLISMSLDEIRAHLPEKL